MPISIATTLLRCSKTSAQCSKADDDICNATAGFHSRVKAPKVWKIYILAFFRQAKVKYIIFRNSNKNSPIFVKFFCLFLALESGIPILQKLSCSVVKTNTRFILLLLRSELWIDFCWSTIFCLIAETREQLWQGSQHEFFPPKKKFSSSDL